MTQTQIPPKDYWSTETYAAAASFVPHFADTLIQSIEFNPTDRVLDIGCGDGKFTTSFAPSVNYVMGVDSSPSMINTAKTLDYGGTTTDFRVVDCRHLEEYAEVMNGNWDKVTSNAAFHWILKDPSTQKVTAFMFALVNHGVPIETAEAMCPWFYPSDVYMKKIIESVGFQVKMIELNPQPLELTTSDNGGLEGFMRLIGAQMLDILDTEEKKNSAIEQICRMLRLLGQGISVVSSPHVLEEMVETKILLPMHDENSYAAVRQQTVRISGKRSPSSEELFRLFDLGIQRRIISNSIKDPTVSVSQKSTIKSFADIFPAVFDPGYRDAMNQRGVTIPMITKAISSLVVGNKNLSTKAKLADLLELTSSHQTGDLAIQPQLPSCNNAVFSSLWCVAQNNVPRIKPRRRGVSMLFTEFPSNALAGLDELVDLTSIDQHQPDNENPGQCHSSQTKYHDENEESDVCLLNSESEDQLLDNFSETSFTDIGESTQTSLDTLLSTTGSSQTSYGDRDAMLLSDHGELADYPENYVIDYDPREDMEACDADIIMADYL
ncbi:hypothetical protein LCP9604111_7194 [Penicillium roqueforti]|uniref:uncharacterized protein n=1 Tax=Penicillium roqueforti TaxID=5082 RepID=UPI0019099F0F|nr:uncharacterized protein LCP9604111_7194 [Penicillium roqueforti]KAF9244802.1 hypothetical protein LCP9604111_7194 [Penicillium roqueforti]KAI2708628.1 hypothetical protein CBS147318_9508 [Penicillium roqueforti]